MTVEEAEEFIAQSVKSDVDIALVADAIKTIKQEPIFDEIKAEIEEISNALANIIEYECCLYGFDDAYKLAKKWQREVNNET